MKLALAGVTILAASGDDGAASFLARRVRHGEWCWSVSKIGLQVSFPASSLWVTGVGATLGPGANTNSSILITSGGGFSTALKRPSWQDGHHTEEGRGVPDLAIVGHAYSVVIGQSWVTADGTSAAAPALGGMLSLINSELLAEGLTTLLYSNLTTKSIFKDVTQGDNRCGVAGYPCC